MLIQLKPLLKNPFQQNINLLHLTKINLNPPKTRRLMPQTLNHPHVLKNSIATKMKHFPLEGVAYTKNSTNLTKLLQLVKNFDFLGFKTTIDSLQADMTAQNDHLAKWAESFALMAWVSAHTATISPTKETLSQTEGEKDDMITEELVSKTADVEKEPEQEPQDTEPIPITIVRPTITPTKAKIIRSSSRPQLIDPIVEVKVSQPKSSSHTTPKPDSGNGIARDTDESPRKLVNASTKVHPDPDTLALIPYKIYGKLYQLTSEQIQAHLDKEEQMEKTAKEARLLEMNKSELIKSLTKNDWKSSQRQKSLERKGLISINGPPVVDSSLRRSLTSTFILTQNKLQSLYKENDRRNFDVHKPFRFGDFSVTEWDESGAIILRKRTSPSLPAPEQIPSLSTGRKRKAQKLEPKVRIPGLECNRSLLEGVQFVNNQVIEHPENGIFFIDVFGDEAFQRMSDIHKIVRALYSPLMKNF
ncbi:hypothetical protein Tco_1068405 [Tanacetum coccineum]|uniref:Uncharacterized protein n=1 Tax=Tanacetum coccineum TaxID=301880 RepID=A0ABQ5HFK8_9ASTR